MHNHPINGVCFDGWGVRACLDVGDFAVHQVDPGRISSAAQCLNSARCCQELDQLEGFDANVQQRGQWDRFRILGDRRPFG